MNTTTHYAPPINGIAWYMTGCVAVLMVLILILFGKLSKDGICFQCLKYVKIRCLKCCGCHKKVAENSEELKEIIIE